MGNYNPYAPRILGQEWAAIRDENLVFQPSVNSFEVGHKFTLATARQVRDVRYYINGTPPGQTTYQTVMVNVYPFGVEDQTGPISQVFIPCNFASVTGSNTSIVGAANIAGALLAPDDGKYISVSYNSGTAQNYSLWFAVNQYPQLANKRILNVSLAYAGNITDQDAAGNQVSFFSPSPLTPITNVSIKDDFGTQDRTYAKFWGANAGTLTDLNTTVLPGQSGTFEGQTTAFLNLGDVNNVWGTSSGAQSEVLPWRYVDLQKLEASSGASRQQIWINFQIPLTTNGALVRARLDYVALRVTYCEEARVAYGGSKAISGYNLGMNSVTLRGLGQNADPILPTGDYLATISSVNPGDINFGTGTNSTFPNMNALRELYAIPPHPGVKVTIPFPAADNVGKVFTSETTHVLPQLTLHSSGGPLTEVHAYGRQVAAQVYGSITATQEIYDDVVGASTVYNQVRFYARRFGDTSVPLVLTGSGSLSGSSVSITPADFDALTEIINGWRAVTLTFTSPPTMGTLATPEPSWIWSATGEIAGNRWEVLGADAPALSGIPASLYTLVPTPNQLYEATYQPPGGAQAELNWVPQGVGSPPVTGNSDDDSADATLIFAVNPLSITGFAASTQTQDLVGIGLDCGIDPCCIPTDILYNRLTWGLPVNTGVASDDFNRVVAAGGWGTASDGRTWTTSGTAANFSVDGAEGVIAPTATASDRIAWVNVGGPEQDVQALVKIADTAETSSLNIGLVARLTDASNYYSVELRQNSTGTLTLLVRKRVAGVATDLLSITVATLNASTTAWRNLRFQVQGTILRAKVWGANDIEPEWMLTISDTSLTTGNNAGAFARDNTTAAAPSSFMFDNFTVNPPNYGFGAYELQRKDTVETDYQTIMRATNVAQTGFSDFEARAGITSTYRIRGVDVYDFVGPWSSEVSIAIPTPGVSGGCLRGGHVLIFTSNERQDGSINLAYSSVWEGRVQEDFTFPEAGFVQMQAMYNRDFFTAFRPTERGGEQFQRTVLVQAAAISPETLADFTSLRDMAWEDVSYICVRDEDGNRWFATVLVPSGRVTRSRKLYMAPVQIIEVTDTPSEVDP